MSDAPQPSTRKRVPGGDIVSAIAFGFLLIMFLVPLMITGPGDDVSALELVRDTDAAVDEWGNGAYLIYALWGIPVSAVMALGLQAIRFAGPASEKSQWRWNLLFSLLAIIAIFVSSAGMAYIYNELEKSSALTTVEQSPVEVFFFPITGLFNDWPAYTLMTVSAGLAAAAAWLERASEAGSRASSLPEL